MKRKLGILFLAVFLSAVFFAGCQERLDTRQYIDTIGVVITNEVDNVINELYVYPANEDGTLSDFTEEMGSDLIKNTKKERRVGSFGVTVEKTGSYNILVRDRDGGVYHFENVGLEDADHGVLTFDATVNIPNLSLRHWSGSIENITGRYVPPDDAPDQTQNPLKKTVPYKFNITNDTSAELAFISMREAANPGKGEVELYVEPVPAGKSVSTSGNLFEEDKDITDWVLHIETADGQTFDFPESFDPWQTETIVFSGDGSQFSFEVS